jgi:hypothetical protein
MARWRCQQAPPAAEFLVGEVEHTKCSSKPGVKVIAGIFFLDGSNREG